MSTTRPRLLPWWQVAVLACVVTSLVATGCSGTDGSVDRTGVSSTADSLQLSTVSSRPDLVTNGDVLVTVTSPAGTSLDDVRVDLGGRDVTSVFRLDDDPHRSPRTPIRLVGLVSGLVDGTNRITATQADQRTVLDVVNHTVDGPLISGPHQSPFVCTTDRNGLGPAEDDCWARSRVRWTYQTTDGRTVDLADPTVTPPDVARIDRDGRSVPFIVRVERGVFNRSVTTFAMLDPEPGPVAGTVPGPTPARVWDDSAWNGRLVYRFGGGCGATFSQGDDDSGASETALLRDGYSVITSSLTSFETACNDVVAAETVMVAKEHFTKAYGLPRFTIGEGGSGGAIQQLLIAQNYPGLLDAIAPSIPFPDAVSIAGGVTDCGLLGRWFGETAPGPAAVAPPSGETWTDAQRLAVTGFASSATCGLWRATYLQTNDPSVGCDPELVRAGQVYDPVTNPRGVRCTLQDSNVNLFGTDPVTGFALRPLDNTGIQYGLGALEAGAISVDQFLDLNGGIGGYDIDGRWQPERTRAPDEVLQRAYADGRVTGGLATTTTGALTPTTAGGLTDVPILLINIYTDPLGDIHDRQRVFAIRDRLRLPDGTANPNAIVWTYPGGSDLLALLTSASARRDINAEAVRVLDRWLSNADITTVGDGQPSGGEGMTSAGTALSRARPTAASDRCVLPDGNEVTGAGTYDAGGPCDNAYPTHSDPRRVAGAPLVGTTLACTLTPTESAGADRQVTFTPAQSQRLREIFPDGVCDWAQPGRFQQPLDGTWRSYD